MGAAAGGAICAAALVAHPEPDGLGWTDGAPSEYNCGSNEDVRALCPLYPR
jgi:hypothetical protein